MASKERSSDGKETNRGGISSVAIQGFKSLAQETYLEIRPLTILAGANSSGKSSIMQPLLLLKQTLQASFDPGPLLLNGPNAKFTSVDQLMSRTKKTSHDPSLVFEIETPKDMTHRIVFAPTTRNQALELQSVTINVIIDNEGTRSLYLAPERKGTKLQKDLSDFLPEMKGLWNSPPEEYQLTVHRERCLLNPVFESMDGHENRIVIPTPFSAFLSRDLQRMIHVPGLRGNPERIYDRTASGPLFPDTFEKYVATIVADWQEDSDDRLLRLETMLAELGLTREISTTGISDTQIELQVGRPPVATSDRNDLVNIADVGFGVSQVLPVLVALLAAERGQLVYIEQPELHLHPRAQYGLARFVADTARRGARLVVESHSALFLLQIQTLMAKGELEPDLVKLHWFTRDSQSGMTSIQSADLDESGAYGSWPEDFGDVELMAEAGYLDSIETGNLQSDKAASA